MRILFLFLIISTACCKSNYRLLPKNDEFSLYPQNPDSLLYGSEWKKNRLENYKTFHLSSLLTGVDSLEIRIWFWEAFDWHKRVLVFKVDSLGWSSTNYYSYSKPFVNADGNVLVPPDPLKTGSDVFIAKEIKPVCGWSRFADSIEKYEIKTLPTEGEIKNYRYRAIRDGYGYIFEIATKKSYRLLHYKMPDTCPYEECKKIVAFLDMLKRQFKTDYCWPNCYSETKKL